MKSAEVDFDLEDMDKKLSTLPNREERVKMLYQWVKTGHCNLRQFDFLCVYISVFASAGA